jgi:twitching motility two-component system response regulator PilG
MAQLVMVIDDSLVIRKIVETCLHRAGYDIRSFPDGVEALCWLNTTGARIPDLVVVDLGLPRLDGYQVIQQIKARPALARTKLVIISRHDGVLDRIKGRLVGAHAYLTKPFKTDQLLAVIRTSLGEAVPAPKEQGRHEVVSSEATASVYVSAGVFPPPWHSASVNVENSEQDRRRMEPIHGHTGESQ